MDYVWASLKKEIKSYTWSIYTLHVFKYQVSLYIGILYNKNKYKLDRCFIT